MELDRLEPSRISGAFPQLCRRHMVPPKQLMR